MVSREAEIELQELTSMKLNRLEIMTVNRTTENQIRRGKIAGRVSYERRVGIHSSTHHTKTRSNQRKKKGLYFTFEDYISSLRVTPNTCHFCAREWGNNQHHTPDTCRFRDVDMEELFKMWYGGSSMDELDITFPTLSIAMFKRYFNVVNKTLTKL